MTLPYLSLFLCMCVLCIYYVAYANVTQCINACVCVRKSVRMRAHAPASQPCDLKADGKKAASSR